MKFLVIGLGSMGKRRIRCLQALGKHDITGYDIRSDRRIEAHEKYSIITIDFYDESEIEKYDAIIISTPPDKHHRYASDAVSHHIPCFIEASVIIDDVISLSLRVRSGCSYVAPSCTLKFYPLIKEIRKIVRENLYGKVTNYSYHCGQYLPDWHPWEDIRDFYVSRRETGGAREIVPFELSWITDILGFPASIKGFFAETMQLGPRIDNTYAFVLKHNDFLGSIVIDVVSRFATRSLVINFERAQLRWNWEDNQIKIYTPDNDSWELIHGISGHAQEGYNKNITEQMYISEIESFLDGMTDTGNFPNNLDTDIKILSLLNQIEESDGGFKKL